MWDMAHIQAFTLWSVSVLIPVGGVTVAYTKYQRNKGKEEQRLQDHYDDWAELKPRIEDTIDKTRTLWVEREDKKGKSR